MSGCLECGRPTQKARCRICRVEHGAPQLSTDDGECPECGRDQLTNHVCNDCERIEDIVGDLDQHDDDLRSDGGRPAFIDPQTESVKCYICGQHIEDMTRVDGMDISDPDEYYPKMVPVCPQHGGEDSD